MSDVLKEICERKREHIAHCKRNISPSQLYDKITPVATPRGFLYALRSKSEKQETALIAEIKKASPSHGLTRADFDPPSLANAYAQGGATCISVLTDTPYFQGEDGFLLQVKHAVNLPVLRKDFMLDPYQIIESRALGADCILLIMAALSDVQARELEAAAMELDMDVLVEVHDRKELERATTQLASPLLGINNRSLKTLEVDLSTTEILSQDLTREYTLVCESGISGNSDIERMHRSGVYCFLVGESLMRQEDVKRATKMLLGK